MRQSATTSTYLMAIVLLLATGTANVLAAPTPGDLNSIEIRAPATNTANPKFDEPWGSSRDDAAKALKKAGGKRSPDPQTANPKFDEPWGSSRDDAAKALKKAAGGERSPNAQTANPKFDEPWGSSRDDAAKALKKAGGGK